MRTAFSKNRESGFSLVEMMVAVGLLATVAALTSKYFSQNALVDAEAASKKKASEHNELWMNAIERDVGLRIQPPTNPKSLCKNNASSCNVIEYDLLGSYSGGEVNETVRITTYCENAPANVRDRYFGANKRFDFTAGGYQKRAQSKDSSQMSTCLVQTPCANGQFPTLLITSLMPAYAHPTRKNRSYPRITWGEFGQQMGGASVANDGISKMVVGTSLCAINSTTKADRLLLETAYASAEGKIKIEKREFFVPRVNMSNLIIVP